MVEGAVSSQRAPGELISVASPLNFNFNFRFYTRFKKIGKNRQAAAARITPYSPTNIALYI